VIGVAGALEEEAAMRWWAGAVFGATDYLERAKRMDLKESFARRESAMKFSLTVFQLLFLPG